MAISDFEDLLAWQQARDLLEDVAMDLSAAPLKQNFRLSAQISDSADSTMANIAEGFERFDHLVDKSRRVGRIIGGLRSAVDRKCRNA
jgi:hypothetical protein